MKPLTVGSLFSGIGGLELGLERAGMRVLFQVEIDPYARRVLAKHWPHVERFEDVRSVGAHNLPQVDILCGGFPCQDVSSAGHKLGLDGERSGLWFQFRRLIRELRPRYVLVENVSALLARGMGRVLGDLAELGFDAEWSVLSACALGAPHMRERVFVVAHSNSQPGQAWMGSLKDRSGALPSRRCEARARDWMEPFTGIRGVADGPSARMDGAADRLRACGNAVVPQVAELIGRRIAAHHAALSPSKTKAASAPTETAPNAAPTEEEGARPMNMSTTADGSARDGGAR